MKINSGIYIYLKINIKLTGVLSILKGVHVDLKKWQKRTKKEEIK